MDDPYLDKIVRTLMRNDILFADALKRAGLLSPQDVENIEANQARIRDADQAREEFRKRRP